MRELIPKFNSDAKLYNCTNKKLFFDCKSLNGVDITANIDKYSDVDVNFKGKETFLKNHLFLVNEVNNTQMGKFKVNVENIYNKLNSIKLPSYKKNIFYIVPIHIAILARRVDLLFPYDITLENETEIHFNNLKLYHYDS